MFSTRTELIAALSVLLRKVYIVFVENILKLAIINPTLLFQSVRRGIIHGQHYKTFKASLGMRSLRVPKPGRQDAKCMITNVGKRFYATPGMYARS